MLVFALNAFHIAGGILAAWALILTAIGLMQHGFPKNKGQERAAIAVSVLLVAAAIGTAIYTSATEEHEGGDEGHEETSFLIRL